MILPARAVRQPFIPGPARLDASTISGRLTSGVSSFSGKPYASISQLANQREAEKAARSYDNLFTGGEDED